MPLFSTNWNYLLQILAFLNDLIPNMYLDLMFSLIATNERQQTMELISEINTDLLLTYIYIKKTYTVTSIKNVIKKLNKNSVNVIPQIISRNVLVERRTSNKLDTKLFALILEVIFLIVFISSLNHSGSNSLNGIQLSEKNFGAFWQIFCHVIHLLYSH